MADTFCEKCVAESTDDDTGDAGTTNGCGVKFYGRSSECPSCGSVLATLWVVLFYFPLFPVDTYRVIYLEAPVLGFGNSKYYSRRMRLNRWQVTVTLLLASVVLGVISAIWAEAEPKAGPDAVVGFSILSLAFLSTGGVFMAFGKSLGNGCITVLLLLLMSLGTLLATIVVGAYLTWWRLEFQKQPQEVRTACAVAAPFLLIAVPSWVTVQLLHPSRVTPRIGPYKEPEQTS